MYSLEFNLNVHHHKYSVNWEHSRYLSLPSPDLSLLSYKTSYLVIFVCRKVSSSLKTQHRVAGFPKHYTPSPILEGSMSTQAPLPNIYHPYPLKSCLPGLSTS